MRKNRSPTTDWVISDGINPPDRLKHAEIGLATFGWQNFADSQLPEASPHPDGKAGQEFSKLFEKTENVIRKDGKCNEP